MAFKGDDSKFSLATTVTLALAVAAVVFVKAPLKSSRPSGNGVDLNGAASELKAHARLWEDPFAAVQKDLEARKQNGLLLTGEGKVNVSVAGKGSAQSLTGEVRVNSLLKSTQNDGLAVLQKKITTEAADPGKRVTVLLVMTRGGAYVDDSEWRIRDRYAVEAALEVGCFKPEQTQFLSYFTWQFEKKPVATPYEWYRRSKVACQGLGSKAGEEGVVGAQDPQVLVLWLASEESEELILQRIDALLSMVLEEIRPKVTAKVTAHLVGPRSSAEFRVLLKEIQKRGQTRQEGGGKKTRPFSWQREKGRLALYSPWATAMPGLLAYGLKRSKPGENDECNSYAVCNKRFHELLDDAGLDLRYSTDSDRLLFESLFEELDRRQVAVGKDSIVLIGEWDSFYARALPLTFSAEACHYITDPKVRKASPPSEVLMSELKGKCTTTEEGVDRLKNGEVSPQDLNIQQYSYLSGLDGEVPEDRASKPRSKNEDKEKEKGDGGKAKLRDIASYEKPEGPSQLDYVRRLVARIKTAEQGKTEQQKKMEQHNKVKAIGILGTDPYDALLILQAMREEFPTVLFFATDLDARYFHEGEQKWARNLLVVSHFGLQLAPKLQQGIPPFRSSYQTATFFAVLNAIGHLYSATSPNALGEGGSPPYTLRLGRENAIEYSAEISARLFEIGRHGAVDLSVDRPDKGANSVLPSRNDVDAEGTLKLTEAVKALWIVFVVLFCLAMWSYGRFWNWLIARDEVDETARGFKRLLRSAWIPLTALGLFLLWCKIRHFNYAKDEPFSWSDGVSLWPTELLRLFVALLCLYFMIKARADLVDNTNVLTEKFFSPGLSSGVNKKPWRRQLDGFRRNLDWMFHGSHQGRPRRAVELWAQYSQAHTWPQRVARIVLWCFLYWVTIWPVWMFMNDGEWRLFVPCRGEFSCGVDWYITRISVALLIVLNLSVLDATLLCARWIHEMPATTGLHAMAQIRLVGERTRTVNYRILYPFVALFLMIAARSHYFDKWDFPPALIMVLTVNSLLALASASLLYRAAVGGKRRVLASIQEQLDRVMTQDENTDPKLAPNPSTERLRQTINEIDAVQQGAFVPFSQQPVVQATLLAVLAFLQYWYLGQ
ncbi:MAG: P-type ATPase [Nitrospira sp.]|nr:MAG: P-type ATPase [Nitrospira sp.]